MQQAKVDQIKDALRSLSKVSKFPLLEEVAAHFQDLFDEYRIYHTLYKTGKVVAAESDIPNMLSQAIDLLIAETAAERGMIILVTENGETDVELARNQYQKDIPSPEEEVSRTIVKQVLTDRQPVCVPDIEQSPKHKRQKSVTRLSLLAVACVPIILNDQLLGLVYLDNRSLKNIFSPWTISLLNNFASQAAIAVDNLRMRRILEKENNALEKQLRSKYDFEPLIGHHPKILKIMELVAQVADTQATVLIEGDTGTGKELIARALHFNSSRAGKELVAINCGALPDNLLESELFGYVRGAFTGANSDKKGKFEIANNGTIFLDEIGEMPQRLQVKLLRILQSGEYSPVGSEQTKRCDVRVIAATNKDLKELVAKGEFRNDLYYRLNIVRLVLPPLVERRADILVLAEHFLQKYRQRVNKPLLTFSRATTQYLLNYEYPGNVRELENIVERATILARGTQIEPEDLEDEVRSNFSGTSLATDFSRLSFKDAKIKVVQQFERIYISQALAEAHGVIRQAARIAQMDVKNFHDKMTKLGVQAGEFK